jgi:glycosyltransferase involved in cell wall biosynthesis
MKLIYIINARIPTQMGHGYQVTKMCESFALANVNCAKEDPNNANKIEVELWVPTRENPIKEDAFEYYGLKRNFMIKKIKTFDFLKYAKYLGALSFYLQSWRFFIKLLFIKIDKDAVIYTRNPEIAYVFKLRGLEVCYECHEWFGRGAWLYLFFLKKADRIITTNSFIKKEFVSCGFDEKRFLVAPNGIDFDIFDLGISKDEAIEKLISGQRESNGERFSDGRTVLPKIKNKKILLYTGSLTLKGEKKGVDEILEAIKILNNNEIIFVAVGGNEKEVDHYRQMADNLGIGDSVYFFPRQTQGNLALFQKMADILLMPFPKIAHYEYYMCPLKMLEYMAGGRPIIASDLPSIREILNDNNSLICRPGDSADLAEKIKLLLDNQSLREKLARQAREDAKKYTWNKRAERIISFINP